MKIFSSKSEVNNSETLFRLISEGEYDEDTDSFIPIDFVLMCTHQVRLADFCDDKSTRASLLKRMMRFHSDICFVPWFDEVDKFPELLANYIPKLQSFANILQINGITATPYDKFWKLMHKCGYYDIPWNNVTVTYH